MKKISFKNLKVCQKLGEGAMSEVFFAKDPHSEAEYAVKLLRSFLHSDQASLDRMKREAEILAQLKDERIVKYYGLDDTEDGRLALIQELVKGENLGTLLNRNEKSSLKGLPISAMALVSEVLLGLEEAHRRNIVHRDLKPENILLTPKGEVKITDFGVAKVISRKQFTVTGTLVGSPAYMSPEQLQDFSVDCRSDFFSLGVLLYHMSTGSYPFDGESWPTLTKAIVSDAPKLAHEINPKIHPELSRIINKALSKDPNERYQKAYEFRFDLMKLWDHLELPSTHQVLASFFALDFYLEKNIDNKLLQTLIFRVEKAYSLSNEGLALSGIKQIFRLDPNNLKAKKLYNKMGRRKWFERSTLLLLLLIFWGGVYQFYFFDKDSKMSINQVGFKEKLIEKEASVLIEEVKLSQAALEKNRPVKVITANSKKIEPLKINRAKTKRETPINSAALTKKSLVSSATRILFNVDENVRVLLDGNDVTQKIGAAFKVGAGVHRIQLVKSGFHPISSTVMVPEGETTIINARSNNR